MALKRQMHNIMSFIPPDVLLSPHSPYFFSFSLFFYIIESVVRSTGMGMEPLVKQSKILLPRGLSDPKMLAIFRPWLTSQSGSSVCHWHLTLKST